MLLGIYYYLKSDNTKFILFFSIAITFKYFALLIFIPLLLLREKKIEKVVTSSFFVMLVFLLEVGFYIHSAAFRNGVFGFGAARYIFNASIDLAFTQIKIFLLGWVLTCAWAYFKETENKTDEIKWALYFCSIVVFLSFGLSMWHPQWLIHMKLILRITALKFSLIGHSVCFSHHLKFLKSLFL